MYRKSLDILEKWLKKDKSKPLILRGARQVGKSYLVRELAKINKRNLIEINLEKIVLKELINKESFDIKKILSEIEFISKKKITQNTLLFIDEIQSSPDAINSLRYFYEDFPELKVIAAGSLLENVIHLNKMTMPVGRVEYHYLGPMTFFEFLEALNETELLEELKKINLDSYMLEAIHNKSKELLKLFYYIGGMPEAILTYIQTKDFERVRDVHYNLLQSYKDDINKYATKNESQIILDIIQYLPNNLGKKVIYSKISNKNSTYVKNAIKLLSMANIISIVTHTNCSGLPLSSNQDSGTMKLYFLDIGLYNMLMNISWEDLKYLRSEELLIKGNIAEQFISQHLIYNNPTRGIQKLYFWLRNKKLGAAEVDFIISCNRKIYPIEVKSGTSGKMKSLWQLVSEKNLPECLRFDLAYRKKFKSKINFKLTTSNNNNSIETNLTGIPLYLVEKLTEFIK